MTPTAYMMFCPETGTTDVTTGARYTVQSVSRFRNLSRPNRMGATVNTVRRSRNACRAVSGAKDPAVAPPVADVFMTGVFMTLSPSKSRYLDFRPRETLKQ